jgi:hypothetical protein
MLQQITWVIERKNEPGAKCELRVKFLELFNSFVYGAPKSKESP